MSTSPSVGTQIQVVLGHGKEEEHYLAEVLEETEKGLIISAFEAGDEVFLPEIDTEFRVRFQKEDSGFEFKTLLLHKREDPIMLCYVSKPVEVTRKQLRAYLRVDCELPVSLVQREDKRKNVITGVVTNISGGGVVIALMTTIPPDTSVSLKFELEEGGEAIEGITAKILSVRPGEGGSQLHITEFDSIEDDTRTEIIRYTFRIQHANRKKAKEQA
ncbi:MAG: PilZ domain-containing protein [Candidatus Lindowbacteria bacterium]|nr:PilZ domain-containing protein [Candidatus Lindowbacteria bacterium]